MCTHTHAHLYICTHSFYTYTQPHTLTQNDYINSRTDIWAPININTHMLIHMYKQTHLYMHTETLTCAIIYPHTHTPIHTQTLTFILTSHTCIHTCTHRHFFIVTNSYTHSCTYRLYAQLSKYIHTPSCTCSYSQTCVVYIHSHTCMHMHIKHAHIDIPTHVHAHTLSRTDIKHTNISYHTQIHINLWTFTYTSY